MSSQPPLLDLVLDALEELKAKNIASLDVRAMTSVADDMVIASGTSSRHVKALADNVMEKAKDAGYRPLGTEGERGAEWNERAEWNQNASSSTASKKPGPPPSCCCANRSERPSRKRSWPTLLVMRPTASRRTRTAPGGG